MGGVNLCGGYWLSAFRYSACQEAWLLRQEQVSPRTPADDSAGCKRLFQGGYLLSRLLKSVLVEDDEDGITRLKAGQKLAVALRRVIRDITSRFLTSFGASVDNPKDTVRSGYRTGGTLFI